MIPPRDEIMHLGYTDTELEAFDLIRSVLVKEPADQRSDLGRQMLRKLWPDESTYIQKTHSIIPKDGGGLCLLKWNFMQQKFYKDVIQKCRAEARPIRAIILKARQLGASTWIQSWQYEQCDRERHHLSMTVSYDAPSTEELLNKARLVYLNNWFPQDTRRNRTTCLEFDNGSVFYAKTSGDVSVGRSLTLHHVHCSEIPMWAYADEVFTGLLQSVPTRPDTSVIIESTAKGAVGTFYDQWRAAEEGRSDFIPFFAPWFWDPEYAMAFFDRDKKRVFATALDLTERRLMETHKLTLEQLNWRRHKIRNDCQGSEAKFRQEFPSTATEAFLTTGAPVFNPEAVANLEQNAVPAMWTGDIAMEAV